MNDNYTPSKEEKGQIAMLTYFLNELSQPSLDCTHHTVMYGYSDFLKLGYYYY